MSQWTGDELERIAAAEEMELATARGDGTLRNPVTIWVVRQGDDLYVRAWRGRDSPWFRGVQDRHEGQVDAGGVTKHVAFVEVDDEPVNAAIDAAYRAKYHHYAASIVEPMVAPLARAATIRLDPRD
ncbi:MAG TPA: DUF2255 family protein [Ktedonobacterales bacterium]